MVKRRWRMGWLIYLVLIFFSLVYLYPFLIQLGTSFKFDPDAAAHPLNPIPQEWTLNAFRSLRECRLPAVVPQLGGRLLLRHHRQGVLRFPGGIRLARLHFAGRTAMSALFIGLLAVPGIVLLIPKYLVLVQPGLYDTYFGMIIPLIADAAGVFIMRQFFINIPVEVEESARLDGASTFRTFWSVVLPMARPALITLTILSYQGSWNELPHFIISRQSPELNTLTSGVATLVSGQLGSGTQFPLKMAAALLMTIPVAVVFFILQRYFVRGASAGAVKG